MKLVIPRLELISLIGKIQSAVPAKPSVPLLGNVLLEALDDELILSATDLTVSMRTYAEARIIEEGSIALPARKFFQLVRELTAPEVEIHCASPEVASINAGSSHFKLQGMHKGEFPTFPEFSDGIRFSIPSNTLKEMLSRTAFSAAKEDPMRPALTGLLLKQTQNEVLFLATDGKRLAELRSTLLSPEAEGAPVSIVLPIKAVDEIVKMLDDKEDAHIALLPDKFAIEVGSTLLVTKLILGEYPDVSHVIPEKSAQPILLHREELMTLLRQVSLFTTEETSAVKFTFLSGELHLSAMHGNIGEGKVSMPVNYSGEKLDIAFNPHNFLDILRHCHDEVVEFNVTSSFHPGLVTDSSPARFIIMPMRLDVPV